MPTSTVARCAPSVQLQKEALTVPAIHDAAEAERVLDGGEELVLAHDLAAKHTINIDT